MKRNIITLYKYICFICILAVSTTPYFQTIIEAADNPDKIKLSDISSHNWKDSISFLQENNIVGWYPDGSFKPEKTINRAELLKIIIGSKFDTYKYVDSASDSCFSDVAKTQWYAPYVCFAKDQGIVNGYKDGTFRPSQEVNFVEALKMIIETYNEETVDTEWDWYEKYIYTASNNVYIPEDVLSASEQLTRGKMSEMIARVILKHNPEKRLGEYNYTNYIKNKKHPVFTPQQEKHNNSWVTIVNEDTLPTNKIENTREIELPILKNILWLENIPNLPEANTGDINNIKIILDERIPSNLTEIKRKKMAHIVNILWDTNIQTLFPWDLELKIGSLRVTDISEWTMLTGYLLQNQIYLKSSIDQYFMYTLIHEIGHYVFNNIFTQDQRDNFIQICWNNTGYEKQESCSQNSSFVSVYANTNAFEDFAETFKMYLTDHNFPVWTQAYEKISFIDNILWEKISKIPMDRLSLTFSDNGDSYAYKNIKDIGQETVIINWTESDEYSNIIMKSFSENNKYFSFSGINKNGKNVLVINNQEIEDIYPWIHIYNYSTLNGIAQKENGKYIVIINGKEWNTEYINMTNIQTAPNGDLYLIAQKNNRKYVMVVNGKEIGNEYRNIHSINESSQQELYWIAQKENGKYIAVINGKEIDNNNNNISSFSISKTWDHLYIIKKENGKEIALLNNKEITKEYTDILKFQQTIDWDYFLIVQNNEGKYISIINGEEVGPQYTYQGSSISTTDWQHYTIMKKENSNVVLLKNWQEVSWEYKYLWAIIKGKENIIISAIKNNWMHVILDNGIEISPEYQQICNPKFVSDETYVAFDIREDWIKMSAEIKL